VEEKQDAPLRMDAKELTADLANPTAVKLLTVISK
jgi:hypothetical protein